jgi:hypothetical protein
MRTKNSITDGERMKPIRKTASIFYAEETNERQAKSKTAREKN